MFDFPYIETERLLLRLFTPDDARELERYADDEDIRATTSDSEVPEQGKVDEWIRVRTERYLEEEGIDFAIILRNKETIIGTVGLGYQYKNDESMQLGYWIGKEYRNKGYCTEAAQAVLEYGFRVLNLHRIYSGHFPANPASGSVLKKIGMKYEGTLRESYKKSGKFEDVDWYAILRSEFLGMNP